MFCEIVFRDYVVNLEKLQELYKLAYEQKFCSFELDGMKIDNFIISGLKSIRKLKDDLYELTIKGGYI